jgi:hypothetical protein
MNLNKNNKCNICNRDFNSLHGRFEVKKTTKHHVVPKQKYRNRWKDAEVVLICSSCQRQINKMFSNNELKRMTFNELLNHQKVKTWIKWINKQKILYD